MVEMRRLCWTLLAVGLVCAALVLPGAAATPSAKSDLTGTWIGTDGSTYLIWQVDSAVSWYARSADDAAWAHFFTGRVQANQVVGDWKDIDTHRIRSGGRVTFRIVDPNHLTYVSSTRGFGTKAIGRESLPIPDGRVDILDVSNGCGPGEPSESDSTRDKVSFVDESVTYTTDFRLACLVHDAGYSGAMVINPMTRELFEPFTMTKKDIDDLFLTDMQTLCQSQVSAQAKLRGVPQEDWPSLVKRCADGSAARYHGLVSGFGSSAWEQRPNLRGTWEGAGDVVWAFTQNVRDVKATWRSGKGSGQFKGTLVKSHKKFTVDGFARIVGAKKTVQGQMMIFSTNKPDQLSVKAEALHISGTITRMKSR